MFGFRLPFNFDAPYRSASIREFWRRWHMTLSRFLRDYLYIPLGGNRRSPLRTEVNVLIVFLVSGFWHGANWTFLIWGGLHGAAVTIEKQLRRIGFFANAAVRRALLVLSVPATFALVLVLWVPFRARGVAHMLQYWSAMLGFGGDGSAALPLHSVQVISLLLFALYFAAQVSREHCRERWLDRMVLPEALLYFTITLLMPGTPTDFIYFQF
jgi:D-alanyl-lipoteichoic acid acyltransferase DltB (MBOAT superfamily)